MIDIDFIKTRISEIRDELRVIACDLADHRRAAINAGDAQSRGELGLLLSIDLALQELGRARL